TLVGVRDWDILAVRTRSSEEGRYSPMPLKSERDLWIEISIREISTQARFADGAYGNLDPKAAGTETVFYSIHSFLSHCAMVSKMLKAHDDSSPPVTIG